MRQLLRSPMFVALAVTLACWGLLLTAGVSHVYWNQRFKNFQMEEVAAPPGNVIVSLDGRKGSGERQIVGSTGKQAQLLGQILAQKPRHVYFDMPIAQGADEAGDKAFFSQVAAAGDGITLVMRAENDRSSEFGSVVPPGDLVPAHTQLAVSGWSVNFMRYADWAPARMMIAGKAYPSVAALELGDFLSRHRISPDFAIDPATIPVIDSDDLTSGRAGGGQLAGRTVFVTATNPSLGSAVGYYGHGRVPSAVADISGVAGMRRGPLIDLGSLPLLIVFFVMVLFGHNTRSGPLKAVIYTALAAAIVVLPAALRDMRILCGNELALIAMLTYGPTRLWQRLRRRVELTNGVTGLPNVDALSADGIPDGYDVVAASISQYEQMLASLPRDLHGECARQIARRLSLASGDSKVYATDNGHFIWLEEPRPLEAQVGHLEGLKALFSAPLVIGSHVLDTNIHFGLDRNAGTLPVRRIQAALASATEAQGKGKLYEEFERQRLAEAPWELSLHARIDEGLRNGDIWLALQAQYDFRSGRISGAEALIRWSDPERGAIPPDAFILAAERAGRIEAITYWVVDRAMQASKRLNELFPPFQVSVNLSARMADHPDLLERCAALVRQHDFDCAQMTFEVTETFSMANREVAKRNLLGLREMGFRLSIDDFGTGQASLAYLAEIPSDELKLDKRFIQAITTDKRERIIVRAAIKLAHALGQEVVAEGVEDQETLLHLKRMQCDLAQGYHIGRPVELETLIRSIAHQGQPADAAI